MKNLLAKLLKVQSEMKPIKKDETNPHFHNRYFDINSLLAELKPILTSHGLVLVQPIIGQELTTIIYDTASEEQIICNFTLPKLDDMQKLGGAISYARRYALVSLFALEGEDDDGNTASAVSTRPQTVKSATASSGLGSKLCCDCDKPYTPKAGTESYSKKCYSCFAKNGKEPIDKSAKPMPINPTTAGLDDDIGPPFEPPFIG